MTIAVLLKQVPDTTAKIAVSEGRVEQGSVSKWSTSPYDEYALEYALQLKESGAGDLVAITCGPSRSSKMLTNLVAVGVDSMLHVEADTSEMDSKQIQSILAAIKHCGADVILCGKQVCRHQLWIHWSWSSKSNRRGVRWHGFRSQRGRRRLQRTKR